MRIFYFTFAFILFCANIRAQSCTENNLAQNSNNNVSGHTNAGQSFTASCSGNIVSVTVTWNSLPTSGTNLNDRVLNIYDGGTCSATLLYSQTIPVNSIVVGPNTITLTNPVPITQGEVNAWEISDANQTSDAGRGVSFNPSGAYSGGDAWYSCSIIGGFDQTFEVAIQAGPSVNLGSDQAVCPGQSVVLDAGNPGNTYLWSTSATTQTITVSQPGTYWVTVTDTGANSATDTIVISQLAAQPVSLGADQTLCPGDSACFNAGNSAVSANWSTGDTTWSVCSSTAGALSVTITDTFGCMSSDTVMLIAVPNPIINLGSDLDICLTGSACFSEGSSGLTYLWSDASTGNQLCVSTPGTVWLIATDVNGCMGSDTANATAQDTAMALISGVDTSLCPIISFTSGSSNAATLAWSFGDGNSSAASNPTNTYAANATYQVTLTATNTCNTHSVSLNLPIDCLTGLAPSFPGTVSIYPNPNQGSFQVSLSQVPAGEMEFRMLDLSGKQVMQRKVNIAGGNHIENFELPGLSAGIYLLDMQVDGKTRREKLVVK
ncbi:MAG: T9SS type A sorting domain-containing protein [Bacteroidia bacterium]|nr:T9SS type A sorting domain-containing protein [Bacteroidia bacterium]